MSYYKFKDINGIICVSLSGHGYKWAIPQNSLFPTHSCVEGCAAKYIQHIREWFLLQNNCIKLIVFDYVHNKYYDKNTK